MTVTQQGNLKDVASTSSTSHTIRDGDVEYAGKRGESNA